MSRARAQAAAQLAGSGGFVIGNIKKFGSTLAASLSKHLEMKHLRAYDFQIARGESLRIADAAPLYRDEGQQHPVLQIKPSQTSAGAYLEVALDYEYVRGACCLTHVSLKVHTGPSPQASALRFRAEWDPRIEARLHAQPHWNIDQVGGIETILSPMPAAATAAPWVPETKRGPWAAAATVIEAPRTLDLRKIHFAMGSSWQLPVSGEDRRHSSPFNDEAALVRWISGCAGYIRAQLAHA